MAYAWVATHIASGDTFSGQSAYSEDSYISFPRGGIWRLEITVGYAHEKSPGVLYEYVITKEVVVVDKEK